MKANELKLADTVKIKDSDGEFNTSIVVQITDKRVILFRPYAITADFNHINGVIPYIGFEQWIVFVDSSTEFDVLSRKTLK